MPELPEVEALRRDLERTLVGRTVTDLELGLPKLFKTTEGLTPEDLVGKRIEGLSRRAKFLHAHCSESLSLFVHLRMTGQLVHVANDGSHLAHGGHPVPGWSVPLPHKATHLTAMLDDGSRLYLTDIRQFARLWLMPAEAATAFIAQARLGPEPIGADFHVKDFAARLARRSIPIKSVLLDQRVISGVGNIYADESLWAANIHPRRTASSLSKTEIARLASAIPAVLEYAIREGVAFVPQGKAISDRAFPYCHGRAGVPCGRCGTLIQKDWVGGRGTYWCPKCQPEKKRRA